MIAALSPYYVSASESPTNTYYFDVDQAEDGSYHMVYEKHEGSLETNDGYYAYYEMVDSKGNLGNEDMYINQNRKNDGYYEHTILTEYDLVVISWQSVYYGEDPAIYYVLSRDGGQEWSEILEVPIDGNTVESYSILLNDGEVFVAFETRWHNDDLYDSSSPSESEIYFLRSFSGISTWSEPLFVSRTTEIYYSTSEGSPVYNLMSELPFISFNDGRLVISWDESPGGTILRYSEDAGATWSDHINLNGKGKRDIWIIGGSIYHFFNSQEGVNFIIYNLTAYSLENVSAIILGPAIISGGYEESSFVKVIHDDDNFKVLINSKKEGSNDEVLYFGEVMMDGQFEIYDPVAHSVYEYRGIGISDFFINDDSEYSLFFTRETRYNRYELGSDFIFQQGEFYGDIISEKAVVPVSDISPYNNPEILSMVMLVSFIVSYLVFIVSLNVLIYNSSRGNSNPDNKILRMLNDNYKKIRTLGLLMSILSLLFLFSGLAYLMELGYYMFGLIPGIFLIDYSLIVEGHVRKSSALSRFRYIYNVTAIWFLFACLMMISTYGRYEMSVFFMQFFFFSPFALPVFFVIALFGIGRRTPKGLKKNGFHGKLAVNIGEVLLFWGISVGLLFALAASFY